MALLIWHTFAELLRDGAAGIQDSLVTTRSAWIAYDSESEINVNLDGEPLVVRFSGQSTAFRQTNISPPRAASSPAIRRLHSNRTCVSAPLDGNGRRLQASLCHQLQMKPTKRFVLGGQLCSDTISKHLLFCILVGSARRSGSAFPDSRSVPCGTCCISFLEGEYHGAIRGSRTNQRTAPDEFQLVRHR